MNCYLTLSKSKLDTISNIKTVITKVFPRDSNEWHTSPTLMNIVYLSCPFHNSSPIVCTAIIKEITMTLINILRLSELSIGGVDLRVCSKGGKNDLLHFG